MKYILPITLLGASLFAGCASTPQPPRELIEARAAFGRANAGPAARHDLVGLHNAQGDLQRAEQSFQREPESEVTRDLSYIALRHAQTVDARGATLQAQVEEARAARDREQATAQSLARVQSELQQAQQQQSMTAEQLAAERQAREQAERQAAEAMDSLRRVAAVREDQRGTVITLSGEVLFASGDATLLPIAQRRLQQVATALREQGVRHLVVEGHTDARGSAATNQQLSQSRAEAVRGFLVAQGISGDQVEAVGLGSSRPVASNETAEGRANNRRVEIVVSPARANGVSAAGASQGGAAGATPMSNGSPTSGASPMGNGARP